MQFEKKVVIEVSGKRVVATVTVDMPGITVDDYLNPQMVLSAVASGQQTREYASRHDKNKVARILMSADTEDLQKLRLVA